ncbi:MAG: AAA family ATPase [Eubacteriales bacterium]|nr:AAA family ATPase [Eubacteriales bacterium]
MLYRKAKKSIENWIENGRDALLVVGARQVGKSFLIRETLKEHHCDYVEFNFIKQRGLIEIFQSAIAEDADRFLMELRVAAQRTLKDDTIIFFDEVQEIKEIVTIIKFLVEKGKYKYVLSGSLLGVELTDLRSAPVGYMTTIDMYPMDLEEFYIANGLGEDVLSNLKKCFEEKKPVNDFIHKTLIDVFYRYLVVGGMPEAVQKFVDTQDPMEVSKIHKKIYRDYLMDFTKYEKSQKLKLIKTYDLIPAELNSKNKRYQFTDLETGMHFDKYENSFNWLIDAGVALPVYNVTEFAIPLEASKKSNLFKLFLSDVGMLTTAYGTSTILKLLDKGKDINCGAMFENFVAQELTAHGFKTYYFNNKKHGEVDFLIEYQNNLLPIEVKSGKDYQNHSALSYFMSEKYFHNAIVLSDYNVKVEGDILYLPIYMTMFLEKEEKIAPLPKIDLSKLKVS